MHQNIISFTITIFILLVVPYVCQPCKTDNTMINKINNRACKERRLKVKVEEKNASQIQNQSRN